MFLNGSSAKRPCVAPMVNHGWWRWAIGGWRLVAVGGSWWRLAVGDDWRLAVDGWRRLVVGGWWQLVAVGGPLGRSLTAVLKGGP